MVKLVSSHWAPCHTVAIDIDDDMDLISITKSLLLRSEGYSNGTFDWSKEFSGRALDIHNLW